MLQQVRRKKVIAINPVMNILKATIIFIAEEEHGGVRVIMGKTIVTVWRDQKRRRSLVRAR